MAYEFNIMIKILSEGSCNGCEYKTGGCAKRDLYLNSRYELPKIVGDCDYYNTLMLVKQ